MIKLYMHDKATGVWRHVEVRNDWNAKHANVFTSMYVGVDMVQIYSKTQPEKIIAMQEKC